MRDCKIEELCIDIGGHLSYADDTALCTNTIEEAQELINHVNEAGKPKDLKLNVKKQNLSMLATRVKNLFKLAVQGLEKVDQLV